MEQVQRVRLWGGEGSSHVPLQSPRVHQLGSPPNRVLLGFYRGFIT